MSVNKNAVIRYMYLDQMLADRHHYYTRAELTDKCNDKLHADGFSEVTKRTIEMDLVALQDAPFSMDIIEGELSSNPILHVSLTSLGRRAIRQLKTF